MRHEIPVWAHEIDERGMVDAVIVAGALFLELLIGHPVGFGGLCQWPLAIPSAPRKLGPKFST